MSDTIAAALIAAPTALLVAFLAHFGAESFRRYKDRVSLAGALAGELASYDEAFPILKVSFEYLLAEATGGRPVNLATKVPFVDDPVFGKTADKLGLLGPHLAEAVAYVYGQLRGFRAALTAVPTGEGVTAQQQVGGLVMAHHFLLKARERGEPTVERLKAVAGASYWQYLRGG